MTSIKSFFSYLKPAGISYPGYQPANEGISERFFTRKQPRLVNEIAMKTPTSKLPTFAYLQKTKMGVLLQQEEILKAINVLIVVLITAHAIAFHALGFVQPGLFNCAMCLSPVAINILVILLIYKHQPAPALFIITWIFPALAVIISLNDPTINYARVLIVYALVVPFLNPSKVMRIAGFCWTMTAMTIIHMRYSASQMGPVNNRFTLFELAIFPIFCFTVYLVLARAKKEYTTYQQKLRDKKDLVEKKNIALENMVTLGEQQRSKLKSTVLLKEKLISIISHDVRVPMNSFKFLIDNYEKGYITEKMILDGIIETKKDIVKLDAMVLDLVDWARTGKDCNEEKPVGFHQMHEIMDSVLSIYTLGLKNKNLRAIPIIDMPANQSLAITKRELSIVMRNLVSNAIKFSTPGKTVIISIQANSDIPGSNATLKVKDFGTGMHPVVLERLNGNRMISTIGTLNEVGLGIGLSIVFDVIHERNLDYNIESTPKKGTEFSISIPMINA